MYGVVCTLLRESAKETGRKAEILADLKLVMMELTPQQEGLRASANQKRLKVSNADNTGLDEKER